MTEEEKIICRLYLEDKDKYHSCNEYLLLMGLIDKDPTGDFVEVVRCKDCKWNDGMECNHQLALVVANDENYCSYGERRDDE